MRVDLIAVPYDSGRRGERMGAGPLALQGGLAERLAAAGHDVRTSTVETPAGTWCGEIRAAFELARGVAAGVREAAAAGRFPLILSGNCGPAAMGGVAGPRGTRRSTVRDAAAELRHQLPPALAALRRHRHVYVHLDLDVLDPSEGRVNGYAAPGGLSRAEVVWALERIAAELKVEAASLTSFDPAADPEGRALDAALSLGVAMVQTIAAAAPR
jgi:arginase family enzyme